MCACARPADAWTTCSHHALRVPAEHTHATRQHTDTTTQLESIKEERKELSEAKLVLEEEAAVREAQLNQAQRTVTQQTERLSSMMQDLVEATARAERVSVESEIAGKELEGKVQEQTQRADLYVDKFQSLQAQFMETGRSLKTARAEVSESRTIIRRDSTSSVNADVGLRTELSKVRAERAAMRVELEGLRAMEDVRDRESKKLTDQLLESTKKEQRVQVELQHAVSQKNDAERTLDLERTKAKSTLSSTTELRSESSDLKASVATLTASKRKLEAQVASQSTRIETLTAQLRDVDDNSTETGAELKVAQTKLKTMTAAVADLETSNTALKRQVDGLDDQIAKDKRVVSTAGLQQKKAQKKLATFKEESASYSARLEKAEGDLRKERKALEALREEGVANSSELRVLRAEKSQYDRGLKRVQDELQAAKVKVAEMADYPQVAQALALSKSSEERLRAQVAELETALHKEKVSKISDDTSKISQLEDLAAKRKEAAELAETVAELELKVAGLVSQAQASKDEAEAEAHKGEGLQEQNEKLQQEMDTLKSEQAGAAEKLAQMESATKTQLLSLATEHEGKEERLKTQIQDYQKLLSERESKSQADGAKTSATMDRITQLEQEISDLQGGAKSLQNDLAVAQAALVGAESEKNAAEEKLSSLEAAGETVAKAELQQLEKELGVVQAQATALESANKDLTAQVQAAEAAAEAAAEEAANTAAPAGPSEDMAKLEFELGLAKQSAAELNTTNEELVAKLAAQAKELENAERAAAASPKKAPPPVSPKKAPPPVAAKKAPPPVVTKRPAPPVAGKKTPPPTPPKKPETAVDQNAPAAKKQAPPPPAKKPTNPAAMTTSPADTAESARQAELERIVEERRLYQLAEEERKAEEARKAEEEEAERAKQLAAKKSANRQSLHLEEEAERMWLAEQQKKKSGTVPADGVIGFPESSVIGFPESSSSDEEGSDAAEATPAPLPFDQLDEPKKLKRSLSRRMSLSRSQAMVEELNSTVAEADANIKARQDEFGTPPATPGAGTPVAPCTPVSVKKNRTRAELILLKKKLDTERESHIAVALEDWKEDYPGWDYLTSEAWVVERNMAIQEFDEHFADAIAQVETLGLSAGKVGAVDTPDGDVHFGLRKTPTPAATPVAEPAPAAVASGGGIKAKMAALKLAQEASEQRHTSQPKDDYALKLGVSVKSTLNFTNNDDDGGDTQEAAAAAPNDASDNAGADPGRRSSMDLGHAPTLDHVKRVKSPSKRPPTRKHVVDGGGATVDPAAAEDSNPFGASPDAGVATEDDAGFNPFGAAADLSASPNPFAAPADAGDEGEGAFNPFGGAPAADEPNPFGGAPAADEPNPFGGAPAADEPNPFAPQPGKDAQKSLAGELQAKLDKKKADAAAKEEAEHKEKEDADKAAAADAKERARVAKEEVDRAAAEEADRLAAEAAEVAEKEAADRAAGEEAARIAEEEADRLAAEVAAKEAADRAAAEEAARVAKEEADRLAAEAAEKEAADRAAAEETARLAKEEADRLAAEEAARVAEEEAERLAAEAAEKEAADRAAAEEAARVAKEEADRLAAETAEKETADRVAAEETARLAKEEADRLTEAEEDAADEKERLAKEEMVFVLHDDDQVGEYNNINARTNTISPSFVLENEGEYDNIEAGDNLTPAEDPFNPFASPVGDAGTVVDPGFNPFGGAPAADEPNPFGGAPAAGEPNPFAVPADGADPFAAGAALPVDNPFAAAAGSDPGPDFNPFAAVEPAAPASDAEGFGEGMTKSGYGVVTAFDGNEGETVRRHSHVKMDRIDSLEKKESAAADPFAASSASVPEPEPEAKESAAPEPEPEKKKGATEWKLGDPDPDSDSSGWGSGDEDEKKLKKVKQIRIRSFKGKKGDAGASDAELAAGLGGLSGMLGGAPKGARSRSRRYVIVLAGPCVCCTLCGVACSRPSFAYSLASQSHLFPPNPHVFYPRPGSHTVRAVLCSCHMPVQPRVSVALAPIRMTPTHCSQAAVYRAYFCFAVLASRPDTRLGVCFDSDDAKQAVRQYWQRFRASLWGGAKRGSFCDGQCGARGRPLRKRLRPASSERRSFRRCWRRRCRL